MKAGWLVAPCTIMEPGKTGAKAVIKVHKLVRKEHYTTIVGRYAMTKNVVQIRVPDHEEIRVINA